MAGQVRDLILKSSLDQLTTRDLSIWWTQKYMQDQEDLLRFLIDSQQREDQDMEA